jgi:hypothetical protein
VSERSQAQVVVGAGDGSSAATQATYMLSRLADRCRQLNLARRHPHGETAWLYSAVVGWCADVSGDSNPLS